MVKEKKGGIFAAVGAATGLGNAFRFPALCAKYGFAFIFAYAVCLALIGFPLLCAELNYGRSARRNKANGVLALIMRAAAANSAVIALYYGVIACKLGGACINFAISANVETYAYMPYLTAFLIFPAVFFILQSGGGALNISGKISVCSSLAVFAFLALKGLFKGVPLPDLTCLLCGELWVEAVGQTLLSLSLAAGVMPVFAKTMQGGSIYIAALKIVFANFLGCVMAALSVCPYLYGVKFEGGIACAFTVYPQVVFQAAASLVGRRILGVCVYGALTAVSVHSLCSLATPLLSQLKNAKSSAAHKTAQNNNLPVLIFCALSALFAPVLALNGGEALSCCDRVACCVTAVCIAFAECLPFARRGGGNALLSNAILRFLIKLICPAVCGVAAFLSVCSARFVGFGALSLCLGALAFAFPVSYSLTPLFAKLKNRALKKPQGA
ncbi:MAG: hypothetical protein ACI4MB_02835 [Candidatus Coproplasma sp.]